MRTRNKIFINTDLHNSEGLLRSSKQASKLKDESEASAPNIS